MTRTYAGYYLDRGTTVYVISQDCLGKVVHVENYPGTVMNWITVQYEDGSTETVMPAEVSLLIDNMEKAG